MTKKELEKRNYMLLKCISFYIHYFKARQGDRGGIIATQKGQFRFIPANLDQVLYLLDEVVKYYNKKGISTKFLKFLDAGCGIGNVLTIANLMGFQVHGIEIDNKNIRIAKKLVTNSCEIHFKIIKGNILTFKNYSNYDVIYFYCPLYSQKKEKKFETKVINDVKVGAIVIPYGSRNAFKNNPRFKCINGKEKSIFVKIKN